MKENMSPNVSTYVKSATQSKEALVLGSLNQAMHENPSKNQLKNTSLGPPLDVLNLHLWEQDPTVCLKVLTQM